MGSGEGKKIRKWRGEKDRKLRRKKRLGSGEGKRIRKWRRKKRLGMCA